MSDELKQQATIDTPEFRTLLINYAETNGPEGTQDEWETARAALIAHIDAWGARMAVPDGWMLVPIESTSEMDRTGRDALLACGNYEATARDAYLCWSEMLAAAPSPTKE
jgi:hypothetical protein